VVVCDRFYDSTMAYQGYGRGLDLKMIQNIIDVAVGQTRPNFTLLLTVSAEISELRRAMRQSTLPFMRDRFEEADQQFFKRVEQGFVALAAADPKRIHVVEASGTIESVCERVWDTVRPALPRIGRW
jgi:dTMP kinase